MDDNIQTITSQVDRQNQDETPELAAASAPQPLKRRGITIALLAVIFAIGISFYFLARPSSKVSAKEYIEGKARDFFAIQKKIAYYEGGFLPLSKSIDRSKQAFYEITTPNKYFDAVSDTKHDIADINETLELLNNVSATSAVEMVPEELLAFDRQLSEYYLTISRAMNLLLEFEEFQMQMLYASGDELNRSLDLLEKTINNRENLDQLDTYLATISASANISIDKFNFLKFNDGHQKIYLEVMKEQHLDIATSSSQANYCLKQNTRQSAEDFLNTLVNLSARIQNRNNIMKLNSENWAETTEIKKLFNQAQEAEKSIIEQLEIFREKYRVEIPVPEPVIIDTATTSADISGSPASESASF